MRRLIKKLKKYDLQHDIEISNWQRDVIYGFITSYVESCDKYKNKKR